MVKVLRAALLASANICFKCENSQREPDKKDSVKIKLKYIGKALKEKKSENSFDQCMVIGLEVRSEERESVKLKDHYNFNIMIKLFSCHKKAEHFLQPDGAKF